MATAVLPKADNGSNGPPVVIRRENAAPRIDSPRTTSTSAPKKLKFICTDGLQNQLLVRTAVKVSTNLTAIIGADYSIQRKCLTPQAMLSYDVHIRDRRIGELRISTDRVQLVRPITLTVKQFQARVFASVGSDYSGKPEFGIDVDSIKPWPVIAVAAGILLYLRKPLSGSKVIGGTKGHFSLPFMGDGFGAKAEVKASVQRQGPKGLQLSFHEINGLLRIPKSGPPIYIGSAVL